MTKEEAIQVLSQRPMIAPSKSNRQKMLEEALDMAIESLQTENEWIPVSERLPDIDTPVIICTASGGITDGYRWNEKDWFLAWGEYNGWHEGNDGERIIAWMPLPKPYGERRE